MKLYEVLSVDMSQQIEKKARKKEKMVNFSCKKIP